MTSPQRKIEGRARMTGEQGNNASGASLSNAGLGSLELIGDGVVGFRNHFVCKENVNDSINIALRYVFLKH